MNIFITGASGFIGAAVATALSRAGHQVHGLTRSADKGARLAAQEVLPVIGGLDQPEAWAGVARGCQVLIHCAAEYSARLWELDRKAMEGLLQIATSAELPRAVIYTSGVWVYGDTGSEAVDEASPLKPLAMSRPRVATEALVLAANTPLVRTLVLRPGCVYGGSGSLSGSWFASAAQGAARVVGEGNNRWAMVHRDDLAELYRLATESAHGGQVFNATDRSRATVLECARAASQAAGAGGKVELVPVAEAQKTMGPMAEALAMDQHVDSSKAVRLLGWQPRHGGFVDGIRRYHAAWQAAQRLA